MSLRFSSWLLVVLLFGAGAVFAPVGAPAAEAQNCGTDCSTVKVGYVCAYDASHAAVCEDPCNLDNSCTVDELVVTASAKHDFKYVVKQLETFVDAYIIPLLYAISFLVFLIGLVRYFFTGGDENREKGRSFVVWGLIGFVVLFGVWGILKLLLTIIPG